VKKRIFNFDTVPYDEDREACYTNVWAVIMDMLPEEDENKLKEDFEWYKNDCIRHGVEYIPAYLWALQRIKVNYNGIWNPKE
jgi:hypothetical protein